MFIFEKYHMRGVVFSLDTTVTSSILWGKFEENIDSFFFLFKEARKGTFFAPSLPSFRLEKKVYEIIKKPAVLFVWFREVRVETLKRNNTGAF